MYFCGDVILMDPCNLVKNEEDWKLILSSNYDCVELEKIGIHTYLSFESSDDSRKCVINDKGEKIGEFCTDPCLFCVLLLEDLLNYNQEFDDYIKYPNSCCVIKDFEGEISCEKSEDRVAISGVGKNGFRTA